MAFFLGAVVVVLLIGFLAYRVRSEPHVKSRVKRRKSSAKIAESLPSKTTPKAARNSSKKAVPHGEFHCVEVVPHEGTACEAVRSIKGKRFLSAEAPAIPLAGCTEANCKCDFAHHEDRRVGDRRDPVGLQSELYSTDHKERRADRRGRRKTD